jgi:hypothetical protein
MTKLKKMDRRQELRNTPKGTDFDGPRRASEFKEIVNYLRPSPKNPLFDFEQTFHVPFFLRFLDQKSPFIWSFPLQN